MEPTKNSTARLWTGRIISGLAVLFMLMDGVFKFVHPAQVTEANAALGFADQHLPLLGALSLIFTLLYIIPRTSILGAVLLTAYLGGAVAAQTRVNNPLFSHVLFPVYIALLIWGGIWLRNEKLKQLLPVQK